MKFILRHIKLLQDGARISAMSLFVKSTLTTRITSFIFLVLSLYPTTVNGGFVELTETCIRTKHMANGFTVSVDNCSDSNRFGAGLGWRDREYEFYLGFHDNLLPYIDFSYRLEHIKTIANIYAETEDTEISPDIHIGIKGTYLLSESWGVSLNYVDETYKLGVTKWF